MSEFLTNPDDKSAQKELDAFLDETPEGRYFRAERLDATQLIGAESHEPKITDALPDVPKSLRDQINAINPQEEWFQYFKGEPLPAHEQLVEPSPPDIEISAARLRMKMEEILADSDERFIQLDEKTAAEFGIMPQILITVHRDKPCMVIKNLSKIDTSVMRVDRFDFDSKEIGLTSTFFDPNHRVIEERTEPATGMMYGILDMLIEKIKETDRET